MCGLIGVAGKRDPQWVKKISLKQSHRGPDQSGLHVTSEGWVLSHERLSIMDTSEKGKQPITGCSQAVIIHNGEIYNHEHIRQNLLKNSHQFRSHSDSETILHLYEEIGAKCVEHLDGDYAIVIFDGQKIFAARDPIGVKPLYYGHDDEGAMWFASEMKGLIEQCKEFQEFPPGHYYDSAEGFVRYYRPQWMSGDMPQEGAEKLRQAFENAVKKRLMSDVPVGVFLSGGLDSSLVAGVMKRLMPQDKLHSFSVAFDQQSTDLLAAREVAAYLGTVHHECVISVEEGIKALEKIIYHLETYDVTTIRAGTPMYLLSGFIRQTGVKVMLSGEGSDEVFGGYLYFYNAPSDQEFHQETIDRIMRLNKADVLRADRATMGQGIEARVPFLDQDFLNVAMSINPKLKRSVKNTDPALKRIEKHVLRAAFDGEAKPLLPAKILWRQKEQFSDGVGYGWIDSLRALGENSISDEEFATRHALYPHNTPDTKEAFFYRRIFNKFFDHPSAIKNIQKWVPKWQKSTDPSGRANDVHEAAYTAPATSAT